MVSDELFARPRADTRVLLPHASSRAARGCVWFGCTQHHSLPSPPRVARVEGVDFRLVVNSAMPCLWPLFTRRREHLVAGASCFEGLYRDQRTAPFVWLCSALVSSRSSTVVLPPLPAFCRRSSHVAALHESALSICVWGDRGSLPWSGFPLLRPPGCDSRRSSVVATLSSCRRCG